jgi:hypothetical protein
MDSNMHQVYQPFTNTMLKDSQGQKQLEAANDSVKPWQWLKAGFACYGIHVASCILVALLLVTTGATEVFELVWISYFLLGWIPLAIWVYPILKKNLR